jgi:hypothetical protein
VDIRTIIKIDDLIKREATGSPAQLAIRLNLSERATFKYLKFMKEELKAPIEYSKGRISYVYLNSGEFNFKWK